MSPMPCTIRSTLQSILLPDLVSYCPFDCHTNRNHKLANIESTRWVLNGDPDLDEAARRSVQGLKAGKLVSMCFTDAGYPQLRVCSDFLNWLFHLDNISDDMDNRGVDNVANIVMNSIHHPHTYCSPMRLSRMTKDLYKRFMQTAPPVTCRRLKESLELFFQAIQQEALNRAKDTIPDLESYIALCRDTSGCKTTWVLIQYVHHLDIPDDVMDHPIILSLGEAANDFIAWSNDLYSYDREQSNWRTHNMIDAVMHEQGVPLQEAVDIVGEYCKRAIDRFTCDRANLPSWGPNIDAQVRAYVDGLANWLLGTLKWNFETDRYFGKAGRQVKASRVVVLRPKTVREPTQGA